MNILMELDENDPDRFHLSSGFKRTLEIVQSAFIFMISLGIFFFMWIGVSLWERLIKNLIKGFSQNKT